MTQAPTRLLVAAALSLVAGTAARAGDPPAPPPTGPGPASVVIASGDGSFRGRDANTAREFQAPELDDSSWATAVPSPFSPLQYGAHYGAENILGIESAARWIWAGDDQSACLLRARFRAPDRIERAELLVALDDVGELWIDGEPLLTWSQSGWGMRGAARVVDLVPWLRPGAEQVLAIEVRNTGGPMGVLAELRINDRPFVPSLVAGPADLDEATRARVDALVARLDDDAYPVRRASLAALEHLAANRPRAILAELRRQLEKVEETEPRLLIEELLAAFAPPAVEDPAFVDPRLVFRPLVEESFRKLVGAADRPLAKVAALVAIHALAREEPALVEEALSAEADAAAADDATRLGRVVTLVGLLELADLRPILRRALERHRDGPTGAWAASALARVGDAADVGGLRAAAAESAYAPTRRAAAWAAARLGERD